jgi:hypothetical protein
MFVVLRDIGPMRVSELAENILPYSENRLQTTEKIVREFEKIGFIYRSRSRTNGSTGQLQSIVNFFPKGQLVASWINSDESRPVPDYHPNKEIIVDRYESS